MRIGIYSLLCLLLFGCYVKYPQPEHTHYVSGIPTVPHSNAVKLYFIGDSIPDKPYFDIAYLTVNAPYDDNLYTASNILRAKAKNLGVDAVINVKSSQYIEWEEIVETTPLLDLIFNLKKEVEEEEEQEVQYKEIEMVELSGVGIKYLETMDYITYYNKTETVQKRNIFTNDMFPVGFVEYNVQGEINEIYDSLGYLNYFDRYSMAHLVHEDHYYWRKRLLREDLLRRKLIDDEGSVLKICLILFDEEGRPSELKVSTPGISKTETINCFYDNENRLVMRSMDLKRFGLISEIRVYDDLGRLANANYYDENEVLKFQRFWSYFELQDVYEFKMDSNEE